MRTKVWVWSILGFCGLLILGAGLDLAGVKWMGFIEPKRENVKREIFKNSQSFVDGKNQELGRYFDQWRNAKTLDDKQAIENLIKIQFADFNTEHVTNETLKSFLVGVRGY